MHATVAPPCLVTLLQAIPAQHTRQGSVSARMVETMVASAAQSSVRRSIDDPMLLATDLAWHVPRAVASGMGDRASGVGAIRTVMKSYKARTPLTPALRLHRST